MTILNGLRQLTANGGEYGSQEVTLPYESTLGNLQGESYVKSSNTVSNHTEIGTELNVTDEDPLSALSPHAPCSGSLRWFCAKAECHHDHVGSRAIISASEETSSVVSLFTHETNRETLNPESFSWRQLSWQLMCVRTPLTGPNRQLTNYTAERPRTVSTDAQSGPALGQALHQ